MKSPTSHQTPQGEPKSSVVRRLKDTPLWVITTAIFAIAASFAPEKVQAAPGDTHTQAVDKGLSFLTPDVVQFTQNNGCIACHRQGAALYAESLAKGAGFAVDMNQSTGVPYIAQAIVADEQPAGSWDFFGGPNNLKSSYNFYGLAGYDAYGATTFSNDLVAAADFALTVQQADGHWIMDFEDGDTAHGDMTTTARYMVGIAQAMGRVDGNKAAAYKAALDKGVSYISAHKDDNSDYSGVGYAYELSWAIIGAKAAGLPDNDPLVTDLVGKLQARKSSLGHAWGYQAGNGPDVFNSGMAIYALCKAGVSAIDDTSLQQSLEWVNAQQGSDGSWGNDINTTFAILGLSCYGDYGIIVNNSGVVTRVISSNSPSAQTVTYDFDIQNHGFINDTYNLTVMGGMPGWTTNIQSSVAISAGQHQLVTLTVHAPPNLPEALPVQMAVVATSQAVPTLSAQGRITTFTDPPPPVSGDSTAVTLTAGNGASVTLASTQALRATVRDTTSNTAIVGPGKGVVTFFVAGFAIATDTDADGDGVYEVPFTPDCGFTALGAQDFRAIYSGIDLPTGQTDLLSSLSAGTITLVAPLCCPKAETCNGQDDDCNGIVDDGFDVGGACSAGIGQCASAGQIVCSAGAAACNAVPGSPATEICGDAVDSDCDGKNDNGCACTTDAQCGGPFSGVVCDTGLGGSYQCVLGCHVSQGGGGQGSPVNGCAGGLTCNAQGGALGQCVGCVYDGDCGSAHSGLVCSSGSCIAGCRALGGNTCGGGLACTSMDGSPGQCVGCVADPDCGNSASGIVCDTTSHSCVLGCRGAEGNGCSTGLVCSSADTSVGQCYGCLADSDCGDTHSGIVCDASTNACIAGCRASGGNGCGANLACTSTDAVVGQCKGCLLDADCGDSKSGIVCDVASNTCSTGCRATGGNGCADDMKCSSTDDQPGVCSPTSGSTGSHHIAKGRAGATQHPGTGSSSSTGSGSDGSGSGGASSSGSSGSGSSSTPGTSGTPGVGCSVGSTGNAGDASWLALGVVGLMVARRRRLAA